MKPDIVVVGGGAAGILASWRAASLGAKVVLLEKTGRLGTKILVSGGGKCNITHAGPLESVLKAFRPEEARFLRPACYRFTNEQVVEMLTSRGLRVMTRPDGRIFPVDQTAKDVVGILQSYVEEAGVRVIFDAPVESISVDDGRVKSVRYRRAVRNDGERRAVPEGGYRAATAKNLLRDLGTVVGEVTDDLHEIACSKVIVCPGGSSYPNSGTTGDGYDWARALGHRVERVRAALAPIYLEPSTFDPSRSGIALRDIVLRAKQSKEIVRWRGDLLFTHQGISGPTALGISRLVEEHLPTGPVTLLADLAPDETFEALGVQFVELAARQPHATVARQLDARLPERLAIDLLAACGISPDQTLGKFEKKSRNRLIEQLKGFPIGTVRHVPLEKGEVVAGGVSLSEVDPHTMRSSLVQGLYLCGEVLDIAGPVGGYNLQAAFATGFVAGESAAREILG